MRYFPSNIDFRSDNGSFDSLDGRKCSENFLSDANPLSYPFRPQFGSIQIGICRKVRVICRNQR